MVILRFSVTGNKLQRTDMEKLVAPTRNEAECEFVFDDSWADKTLKVAQFSKNDECVYDVVINPSVSSPAGTLMGKCTIPWEVLEGEGVLSITVAGGDLITTNAVNICVYNSGLVGGLVPTVASPGLYSNLQKTIEKLADEIITKKIIFKDGSFYAETIDTDGNKAYLQMDKSVGIRLLNSITDDDDHQTIKIGYYAPNKWPAGAYDDTTDNIAGIIYKVNEGFRAGDNTGNDNYCCIILTPDKNGVPNVIKGNENLKIISKNGQLSFDTDDAGITYRGGDFDMSFKQLNVSTDKGVNMEALNNSYWWVNAEKKAVYGNKLHKLEFRTDGVAKFSNVVNAKDYQIGGIELQTKSKDWSNNVFDDRLKEFIAMTYDGNENQLNYLINLSGGIVEEKDIGKNSDIIIAYICNNGDCYILGEGGTSWWEYEFDSPLYRRLDIKNVYFMRSGDIFINQYLFYECENIENIILPNNITGIEFDAFYGCTSLTSVNIPNSVTSIGSGAFRGCSSLTNIIIPNSVTNIGNYVFSGCTSLTSITIPDSVTSIYRSAFYGCTNLTSITINKTADSITGAPWGATNATVVWTGTEEAE